MKKFKLIKEYPNSPELNTIITKIDTYWGYPDGHDSNRVVFLHKNKPEDYPEYWEEVVEKVKQPLFTTNDGVDIFEGDFIYGLKYKDLSVFTARVVENGFAHVQVWSHGKFSTREAAEEYAILNKPQLSFRDIEHLLTKKGKIELLNRLLDEKK